MAEGVGTAAGWQLKPVRFTVPVSVARAAWRRARSWGRERGGRFIATERAVFVCDNVGRERTGMFCVLWDVPSPREATINVLAWNALYGGSEAEVRQAIGLLFGDGVDRGIEVEHREP